MVRYAVRQRRPRLYPRPGRQGGGHQPQVPLHSRKSGWPTWTTSAPRCRWFPSTPRFSATTSLPSDGLAQAKEVNEDIAQYVSEAPSRFAGNATLPMQDVPAAIAELDRAVNTLGLKGAELDTVVNGKTWDEPEFLPFFKAAESMGAVLFFHPQPQHNLMLERTRKYALGNSVGVPVEDTLLVSALIFGGVMEQLSRT